MTQIRYDNFSADMKPFPTFPHILPSPSNYIPSFFFPSCPSPHLYTIPPSLYFSHYPLPPPLKITFLSLSSCPSFLSHICLPSFLNRLLYRDYGDNCRIVGIADGFGVAEDPKGLDRTELLRLVAESRPVTSFNKVRTYLYKYLYICTYSHVYRRLHIYIDAYFLTCMRTHVHTHMYA